MIISKDTMQYTTATVSLLLGHVLIFLDFFLTENHIIHEPTLWYFGQCCVLFATVFGVIKYVNAKISALGK